MPRRALARVDFQRRTECSQCHDCLPSDGAAADIFQEPAEVGVGGSLTPQNSPCGMKTRPSTRWLSTPSATLPRPVVTAHLVISRLAELRELLHLYSATILRTLEHYPVLDNIF